MASTKDPEADKDNNEEDKMPAGGKMRKAKGKKTKEMMWKINGKWMDHKEYLEYVSSKDPHNTEKYWKMTQKDYRFRKAITDSEIQCYVDRYPDLQQAFGNDKSAIKKHWEKYGIKEKRNKFCYSEMT